MDDLGKKAIEQIHKQTYSLEDLIDLGGLDQQMKPTSADRKTTIVLPRGGRAWNTAMQEWQYFPQGYEDKAWIFLHSPRLVWFENQFSEICCAHTRTCAVGAPLGTGKSGEFIPPDAHEDSLGDRAAREMETKAAIAAHRKPKKKYQKWERTRKARKEAQESW